MLRSKHCYGSGYISGARFAASGECMGAEAEEVGSGARQALALLLVILMVNTAVTWSYAKPTQTRTGSNSETLSPDSVPAGDYDRFSRGNFSGVSLSKLNLSLSLNETDSSVRGILLIDFYNGDPLSFSRIPFHLYPSGMAFASRPGRIDIQSVTTAARPPEALTFDVSSGQQLMWVNLPSAVQPDEYASLNISFTTTLPDGGFDRAGAYGTDMGQTRVFTFASCYPVPCVYDEFDGWNIDPYIQVGDPFYYDMASYDLLIDVPEGMVVAATGNLAGEISQDGRVQYHYSITLPVREITFSASRYYIVESTLYHGVNSSTFYLPASAPIWENHSLQYSIRALELFNSTFGIYPYPTLNVVEQHAAYAGMEYPCQVYITRGVSERINGGQRAPWYIELVIAHEVAHQWWSQIVGDNCVDWGFLDEGLASWSHSYYAEHYYSDWEYFQEPRLLDTVRSFPTECTINQSNFVRPDLTGYVDYVEMPVVLEKLRRTIGNSVFVSGLSRFLMDGYFLIATLNDLQTALETIFKGDLDWFFRPWFNNARLPNYAIQDALYNSINSSLTFDIIDLNRQLNTYDYCQQVPVMVYNSDQTIIAQATVWINGSTTVTIRTSGNPHEIRLDYNDYVIVFLQNSNTRYYSTDQIVESSINTPLPATALAASILAVLTIAYYLRKRRTG